METFKKFIDYINGKKSIIGLIGLNIMQLDMAFIANMNPDLKTLLMWIFGTLSGIGLTHKALKKKK